MNICSFHFHLMLYEAALWLFFYIQAWTNTTESRKLPMDLLRHQWAKLNSYWKITDIFTNTYWQVCNCKSWRSFILQLSAGLVFIKKCVGFSCMNRGTSNHCFTLYFNIQVSFWSYRKWIFEFKKLRNWKVKEDVYRVEQPI